MNKKKIIRLVLWAMVVVWMAVIFALSSQSADQSDQTSGGLIRHVAGVFIRGFHAMHEAEQESIVSAFQFSVRIAGHILEYMILGMLCTAALFQYELSFKKRFFISACICLLYAVSDEVHQLFVPGRSCQISDIGFDFLGSVLGSLAISGLGSIVKKRHKKASDPINPSARSSASAVKIKKQP
ncbi:MAG: VanZ family protein [Clostridiales bacterium]|jgi:VanZ family protein|nr:VanZ family protein [Clostridiales bacterium]